MSGSFLLDTNIAIAFLENEAAVVHQVDEADRVYLVSVVVGELSYGAQKSGRPRANLARIEALASRLPVLACDVEVAWRYGEIKRGLRDKGRPIPENDIWIAAAAIEHNLTLVTRDGHFAEIAGLSTQAW
jgi:tRNA(fMet)-specific endonuclease VapC